MCGTIVITVACTPRTFLAKFHQWSIFYFEISEHLQNEIELSSYVPEIIAQCE